MASLLHSILSLTNYKSPLLRTLIPTVGLAFGIQAAAGVPSIYFQTERYYDLSGSLTYLSCTALSLFLPTIRARAAASISGLPKPAWPSILSALNRTPGPPGLNWRQLFLSAAVTIWATRLGTYLFQRISADGSDSRFDKIKKSPPAFFGAFLIQAVWVSTCLMPVIAINALPLSTFAALPLAVGVTDLLGVALYAGGLGFEVVADMQKDQWVQEKKAKKHSEEFLTRGLWSKSRHPNYFGEATLWTGIATLSAGVLASKGGVVGLGLAPGVVSSMLAVGMAGISPAFVIFLLLKVSGVPMSEGKYDKRYGNNPAYKKWKAETPVFVPKF